MTIDLVKLMKHIVLLSFFAFAHGAFGQAVMQSFTGTVYISSGGPGLFGTPAGTQVSGMFTVSVGSLGTPSALGPTLGYNTWSQTLPNGIPQNNSDSVSATSPNGSFSVSNLQSVILGPTFQNVGYGSSDPLSTGPNGGFGLVCPLGSPSLPIDLTAFPLLLPAGCTATVDFTNNLNQYFIEINLTSVGNKQIGPVVMLDPVPSLLSGPEITNDRSILAAGGRVVQGIAADGNSQIVFRIPVLNVGDQVTATLYSDQCYNPTTCAPSTSANDDGGVFTVGTAVDASTQLASSLTDTAVSVPYAFIAYRAPVDFVRSSSTAVAATSVHHSSVVSLESSSNGDSDAASRLVYFQFKYFFADGTPYYVSSPMPLTNVRSPVILVHGLWANANDLSPTGDLRLLGSVLIADQRFNVYPVNYGGEMVKIYNPYPESVPSPVAGSNLGINWAASFTADRTYQFLQDFRNGDNTLSQPVSATQTDFVAHSMGSVVTRQLEHLASYRSTQNHNNGYIHKLISIGGPHLGSPVAQALLEENGPEDNGLSNVCIRYAVSTKGFYTIQRYGSQLSSCQTATDSSCLPGAIADLAGTNAGVPISPVLKGLQIGGSLPIAYITGELSDQEVAALSGVQVSAGSSYYTYDFAGSQISRSQTNLDLLKKTAQFPLTAFCGGSLAGALNATDFQPFMGGPSDGIVPLRSQGSGQSQVVDLTSMTGNGYVHSGGAATLGFGTIDTSGGVNVLTLLDEDAETAVVKLLNTPVTDTAYVREH